ncbi:MAG: hypothetical protein AB8B69_22060 [Chitinophagales bacterium]
MKTITISEKEYFEMKSTIQKLELQYQKLLNKLEVIEGIRVGLLEVKEAKRTGKKLQSLDDFLKGLTP